MPIKQSIWRIGQKPTPLMPSKLENEELLEEMIESDASILEDEWLLIGRQVVTKYKKEIDLLAIAPDSSLVIIELKKSKTPRDVVAQAIDYASWVEHLKADEISSIYENYSKGKNLKEAFKDKFHVELEEENLNQSHQMVIVASELDDATERIINYLSERGIAINAVFFEVFSDGKEQFLSRRWFVDPAEVQSSQSSSASNKEPWNGEFFVSFGDDEQRSWEDARKYGFISAGGGIWYSRTLNLLKPNDRIWVRIPKDGYVGVGIVESEVIPASEFEVEEGGKRISILDATMSAHYGSSKVNTEDQEYFVKVKWINTYSREQAYDELGFFGNQNSVCKPTAARWRSTVEHLKDKFGVN
jgi:hypothetical protein